MSKLGFLLILILMAVLVAFGLSLGGAVGESAKIRAEADAVHRRTEAYRLELQAEDDASTQALSREARAQAVAIRDTGAAIAGAVFLSILGLGGGGCVVVWVWNRSRRPQVVRSGSVIAVYAPTSGAVLAFDKRVPGLPIVVAAGGSVTLPTLPLQAIVAAINGQVQEAIAACMAQAAGVHDRALVLSQLFELVKRVGRPEEELQRVGEACQIQEIKGKEW